MITSVGTGKHLQNRLRGFKKKRSVQSTGWRKRKRERGEAERIEGGGRGRGKREGRKEENYFFSVIEVE